MINFNYWCPIKSIESTKTWHLGPVVLYQELEAELE